MDTRGVRISVGNRTLYWQSQNPLIERAVPAVVAVECYRGGDSVVTQTRGPKSGRPEVVELGERFWSKVDRCGPDECWPWLAGKTKGYGTICLKIGDVWRSRRAHRLVYAALIGPIPEGLTLDHLCRNHDCCNPGHCEPVTNKENILRGTCPTAVNARKTHCPQGHPYSEENTQVGPTGWRYCRICARANDRQYKARKRARLVAALEPYRGAA